LTDFVQVEIFCMRFILDSSIYTTKLIEKDFDVSLRIDEPQNDTIFSQKMSVSESR